MNQVGRRKVVVRALDRGFVTEKVNCEVTFLKGYLVKGRPSGTLECRGEDERATGPSHQRGCIRREPESLVVSQTRLVRAEESLSVSDKTTFGT